MNTMSKSLKMTALALRFPSVRDLVESGDLPGVDPFSAETLIDFLENAPFDIGRGARNALLFLLYVWNPRITVAGSTGKKEWVLSYDGDPAERDVAVQRANGEFDGRRYPLPPCATLVQSSIGGGRFDMAAAFATWDADHRGVFQEWASDPWWA